MMKLGYSLSRLSSRFGSPADASTGADASEAPAYAVLNDQTWTAIFSWLSTADLARSRVRLATHIVLIYANGICLTSALCFRQYAKSGRHS